MSGPSNLPVAVLFAERLNDRREEVAHDWLHRLVGQLEAAGRPILPIKHLLDVAPAVVEWVAREIRDPGTDPETVREMLRESVELQRSRSRRASDVARDVDLLSDIVFDLLRSVATESPSRVASDQVAEVGRRIHRALSALALLVVDIFEKENGKQLLDSRGRAEEFVRTLAHELKNPLGAAEIALQMLADDELITSPEEMARYTQMIARNVSRGLNLIDELRARALPELGSSEFPKWSSIRSIVQDVVLEVAPAAEERGVSIHVDDLPAELEVPARPAKLVLMNLVWNAVKYSDPKKEERWIRIVPGSGDAENVCLLQVQDNGLGIPPEDRDRVFERFYRAHAQYAEGTGLGLAIAREAAEEAGGGLWLESEHGGGCVFTAAFTVRGAADVEEGAHSNHPLNHESPEAKNFW